MLQYFRERRMAKRRALGIRAAINLDQLDVGQALVAGRHAGDLPARHKFNTEASPYCVANELICAELGHHIRLPIPSFAITFTDQLPVKYVFSTLDVNYAGRDLMPIDPTNCVKCLPELCAGILVFDIFVVNSDRHDENLVVDRTDNPREIYVYDHDAALFGTFSGGGLDRLRELRHSLGVTAGPHSGGNRHCLLDAIETTAYFRPWISRIGGISYRFLSDVCNEARRYGITREEAEAAIEFLEKRKTSLVGLMSRHREEFTGISLWKTI